MIVILYILGLGFFITICLDLFKDFLKDNNFLIIWIFIGLLVYTAIAAAVGIVIKKFWRD